MQYVKNTLVEAAVLAGDKEAAAAATSSTTDRKFKEIRLALALEKVTSKKDILAGYLNIAYFGNQIYGIEAAANVVIAKFGNLIPVNLPIIEVLSTTSEFELNAYQSNPYLASTLLQNSGSSQSRDNAYNNKFNVSAGAFPVWPEGVISAYGVVYRNASNNNDPGFFDYAVGAHETMHIIQLAVSQGKASGFLPVWFLEGQATQFGNLYETSNETISQALAVANSFPFPQGSNDLTTLETYTGMDCCGLAYSRGQAATNFLTGKFGWEKVLKFTKSSDTYSDWKTAFQAIFDEPVSQFYTEVQPFIAWMKNVIQP
jgi:hypothetical protein